MSKRRRQRRGRARSRSIQRWAAVGLVALAAILVAVWWTGRSPNGAPATGPEGPLVGAADACRRGPSFAGGLGMSNQASLATALTTVKGLAVVDPQGNGGQGSIYQHETWDDAGFLGPFITDRRGHVYVAPVPLVSLVDNPPDEQNRVYRVDGVSQEMALLAELQPALPPTGNPFGVVGLAYDCDTESLYATSVAGSTATQVVGRIFRIGLERDEVLDWLEGVDAVGVGVFNGTGGKRLYYGSARQPELWSVALDAAGAFVGEPRLELGLAEGVVGGRDTVRRVRFTGTEDLTLQLMDFTFSLQVASEREEDTLRYRYDAATDAWVAAGSTGVR